MYAVFVTGSCELSCRITMNGEFLLGTDSLLQVGMNMQEWIAERSTHSVTEHQSGLSAIKIPVKVKVFCHFSSLPVESVKSFWSSRSTTGA